MHSHDAMNDSRNAKFNSKAFIQVKISHWRQRTKYTKYTSPEPSHTEEHRNARNSGGHGHIMQGNQTSSSAALSKSTNPIQSFQRLC
jgi:hypothetical protein